MLPPYRSPGGERLWVCIACYKTFGPSAGACPACGAPRLDLARDDVVGLLRERANGRVLLGHDAARTFFLLPATVVLAGAEVAFLCSSLAVAVVASAAAVALVVLRKPILRQSTAVRLMAARRRRTSQELGVDVQLSDESRSDGQSTDPALPDAEVPTGALVDPLLLPPLELVRWLGMLRDPG